MILALDVGNSQIFGGLFSHDKLVLQFRKSSKYAMSSDELGLFLRAVITENGHDWKNVKKIAICSVVPDLIYSLTSACKKYFKASPFILQAGVKTGLKIKYRNPLEVGADRIANAIAGINLYPKKNLIIVDLGTATTFCAINDKQEYLGGSIVAGLRLSMEALEDQTAKLPVVEIIKPEIALGTTTVGSIQSGLYYGHLGTMRELICHLSEECFVEKKPYVIGTGGFSYLFEEEKIFDQIVPNLVLQGLLIALRINAKG